MGREEGRQYMGGNRRWRNSHAGEAGQQGNDLLTGDKIAVSPTVFAEGSLVHDPLWTPEQVARRMNVSPDWVRDHSGRKEPRLPVIRLGGGPGRAGLLRYRASEIEKFIAQMEHLSDCNSRTI